MALNVVIMAAGKGTRMKSALPKVLHRLAGRSLVQHVLDASAPLEPARKVVIIGHGADAVESALATSGSSFVHQMPQLGTGHAVQQAVPALDDAATTTLVLNGDVPLIRTATARALADACGGTKLALLTIVLPDATGYGRILRGADGQVQGIVEHKDASPAQREIREIYTGILAAPTAALKRWVGALKNDNVQKEYYLTDIVAMAVADGVPVVAAQPASETEVLGVNSPVQLADLERRFQLEQANDLMESGVRLADPARFDLRGTLRCGSDVEIDVNCIFDGSVELGNDVRIGANCVIRNAQIADGAVIHPFTHIDGETAGVKVGPRALVGPFARLRPGAVIHPFTHIDGETAGVKVGTRALVGPFARLRPGADLGAEVHIGNFVEVKNSTLAAGAKANHLAYLGDSVVGERVNYGAGSITANYDGANKHRTVIEADAHIGSNCVLVAPVTIGAGATIGGGSTISKDAPAGQLTVARARQASLPAWVRPKKAPKST